MRHIQTITLCAAACFGLASSSSARASLINYIIQGVGNGNINNTPFTNQPFTFTITADTDNVQNGSFYIAVNNSSISLQIGADTFTGFAGSSWVFPQPGLPTFANFSFVQALVGTDWDSAQLSGYHLAFQTYDMKTAVGPLTLPTTAPPAIAPLQLLLQTSTAGIFIQPISQATFQAILVPEPATLLLTALAAAALLTRRRAKI